MKIKISKYVVDKVRIESHLPDVIFKEVDKYIDKGYSFQPLKNYIDEEKQKVFYTIGEKER